MTSNHKPVNDPDIYTIDLVGLLSSQLKDSNQLIHSIMRDLSLFKLLQPNEAIEEGIDEIIEQITEHQKKQNIELETFAKIKNVKLKSEE